MDISDLFTFGSNLVSYRDTDEEFHNDFLRFFSIAIALDVNIFPLVWKPALEDLGEGATGLVSWSPLNKRHSLAFKRLVPWKEDSGVSKGKFRTLQYNALVSEMAVLKCPRINHHPNIINLEGLCWQIAENSTEV